MKGLFISGSGTDVGKTFIAERIIKILSEFKSVSVRKPVESNCTMVNGNLVTKDALALLCASNVDENINTVCAYQFSQCASGERASRDSGVELSLLDLASACESDDYVVVEGAGGLLSPIAQNTLNIDLVKDLNLPLVIVVKDELGAVNQALLSLKVARQYQLNIAFIVLNQFEKNTLNNVSAIKHYSDCEVVVYNHQSCLEFEQKINQLLIKQG